MAIEIKPADVAGAMRRQAADTRSKMVLIEAIEPATKYVGQTIVELLEAWADKVELINVLEHETSGKHHG